MAGVLGLQAWRYIRLADGQLVYYGCFSELPAKAPRHGDADVVGRTERLFLSDWFDKT
jgi:hypothetical protein